MSKNENDFPPGVKTALLVVLFMAGVVLGNILGCDKATGTYRRGAIDRGFAEYDSKTGAWKWEKPDGIESETKGD